MALEFWSDGTDYVIAESADDAAKVYEEFIGEPWNQDGRGNPWALVHKDEKPMNCLFEDVTDIPEFAKEWPRKLEGDHLAVSALPSEWIAGHGRSFFASMEA